MQSAFRPPGEVTPLSRRSYLSIAGQVREEAEVLWEVSQPTPDRLGPIEYRLPVKRGFTRCGLEQPGEDPHQSRLARAVGAKESEHPVGNVEINTLKCGNRIRVDLHEVSNGQHGAPFLQGY